MEQVATVGQRFSELIAHLGISKNAFAMSLDKTATVIQHLVDERNKPGFDLLCKVFEIYPNVSKDWLLEGHGPMLNSGAVRPAAPPEPARAVAASLVSAASATVAAAAGPEAPTPAAAPAAAPTPAPAAAADDPAAQPAPTEPAVVAAPAAAPVVAAEVGWQSALYTQQMAHQLALAELRNQHLQEQQRLMQQMLDLMQRQLTK